MRLIRVITNVKVGMRQTRREPSARGRPNVKHLSKRLIIQLAGKTYCTAERVSIISVGYDRAVYHVYNNKKVSQLTFSSPKMRRTIYILSNDYEMPHKLF